MADAQSRTGGQDAAKVSRDSLVAVAWQRWRQALRQPADRLLLIVFSVLQLADIASTNHALAFPGNHEGNPLMASLQAHLGDAWWVPKIAAMLLVCLAAPLTRRRWPMIFAVSFCLLVVAGNLIAL